MNRKILNKINALNSDVRWQNRNATDLKRIFDQKDNDQKSQALLGFLFTAACDCIPSIKDVDDSQIRSLIAAHARTCSEQGATECHYEVSDHID